MKKGYYLFLSNKREFFIETKQVNITRAFSKKVLEKINTALHANFAINSNNIEFIKSNLMRAALEEKTLPNGIKFINISGDNFGGYGDTNTVIISL